MLAGIMAFALKLLTGKNLKDRGGITGGRKMDLLFDNLLTVYPGQVG